MDSPLEIQHATYVRQNTNVMAARVYAHDRENPCAPDAPVAETVWKLPADLLLEIVARSDVSTLVTFTAVSKLARRDVLEPSFIRRVSQKGGIVHRCILAYLNTHDEQADTALSLSLVHPATPAAASFLDLLLSPCLSRFADELLGEHYPMTSRGGLVLLQRCNASTQLPNLCLYDLITGHRTFLSDPPGIGSDRYFDMCVLLTAADGICCSFMLFVANIVEVRHESCASTIEVHTATSTCGTWAPAVMMHNNSGFLLQHWHGMYGNIVVLEGGFTHWLVLVQHCDEILSYNVCTMEQSTIKLPAHVASFEGSMDLGSYYSRDGRKLPRLLGIDGFRIFVWRQLSGGYWESEPVIIDTKEKLRSLDNRSGEPDFVWLKYFGEGSNTVLLHVCTCLTPTGTTLPVVLDLETKEMCVQQYIQLSHPL